MTVPNRTAVPLWVWLVAGALALTEPAMHAWLAYGPGADAATGLRTGDSHVYLHAMRAFDTGFHTPYASVEAPLGARSWRYFALPTHFLYAAIGYAAHALFLPDFLALGIANGICAFLFLLAAHRLLRAVAPHAASAAFLLFALGGGVAGPLYLAAAAMGWPADPAFERWFGPFANYGLVEGAHLWPFLLFPRLYYTLSLAAGFLAFARIAERRPGLYATMALLFAAQLINMRAGTFVFAMLAVWLLCNGPGPMAKRIGLAALLALPIAAGGAVTIALLRLHPAYAANVYGGIGETAWFSALLCAAGLHVVIAAPAMAAALRTAPKPLALAAGAGLGYLTLWIALYAAYQVYYGNRWPWGDATAAVHISDWALAGAVLGALGAAFGKRSPAPPHPSLWAALWLVAAIAVAISAWGQGAFMNLLPRRMLITLALPLAILAAESLAIVARPTLRRGLWILLALCGLATVAASALAFQGPFGQRPGEGAFARLHYERMTPADSALLDALPPGRVLAPAYTPWSFTEVIALRPQNSVVFGVGTLNHSDLAFEPMKNAVDAFFRPGALPGERRAFLRRWGARYVYCPDTCPVDPAVLNELRALPFLRPVAEAGRGAIFAVDGTP